MGTPYVFIADVFANEIPGGGELNNDELIHLLREKGEEVITLKSSQVSQDMVEKYSGCKFIIGNFISLRNESKEKLLNERYVIYEHDHKYLKCRNPAEYENYLAPPEEIIYYDFYKSARAVVCQSTFHADIVRGNLKLDNIKSVGGNLWSEKSLDVMGQYARRIKENKCSIMISPIVHKNTSEAISYCEYKRRNTNLSLPVPIMSFWIN